MIIIQKKKNLKNNIDRIPSWKSSLYQLWPILVQFGVFNPIVVGKFGGNKKPDIKTLLFDFLKS